MISMLDFIITEEELRTVGTELLGYSEVYVYCTVYNKQYNITRKVALFDGPIIAKSIVHNLVGVHILLPRQTL